MANPQLLPQSVPDMFARVRQGLADGHMMRVINFHATPSYLRDEYRRQMEICAKSFTPVDLAGLDSYFAGTWAGQQPGLIPVVYEGFRDAIDVMLPILEEFGFKGWFFVPSRFPNIAVAEQRSFAAGHFLHPALTEEYEGERMTLSWEEARTKARGHVFACHSRHHTHVMPDTSEAQLVEEIVTAKAEIEAGLEQEVKVFAWLFGTETGINPRSDQLLRDAGFQYLFSNFKIQKLR